MKVIILLLMVLTLTGCEETILSKEEYLKKNHDIINLSDTEDYDGFEILEKNLKDKEIILTGESHGIELDDKLRMKLLKYLNEVHDVKYYLMETTYSNAYFINKYLESGDEDILVNIFKNYEGTYSYNKDEYNFIKDIYEYNKNLNKEDKIKVVGIDIEFQLSHAQEYLEEVLNQDGVSISVGTYSEALKFSFLKLEMNDLWCESLIETTETVLKEINNSEKHYKETLKEEYVGVNNVLKSIIAFCETILDGDNFSKIREERIYENFTELDASLEEGKYFGQWGNLHIFKYVEEDSDVKINSLATMIKSSDKYKDKVLTIAYMYEGCTAMVRPTEDSGYTERKIQSYVAEEFLDYNKENCYIFDINKERSPYEEKEYLDYIVVINNSKASEPLSLD